MSSSEWKDIKLGDVCEKIGSGVTPRGGENVYINDGVALIRSQNIYDFLFEYNGLAYIDSEQADKMKNVEIKSNDILINITGDSVARCCIVPENILPARVNQHVSIIRTKNKIINAKYLQYRLIDYSTKELLLSLAYTGGTRKALTKAMIENLQFKIPSIIEQKAIADTLSCLDEKIELNNRINKNLEEMAQAIFKSWFVDFEPFQDGEFEDSELGRIPEGWRVIQLKDLCKQIKPGTNFQPQRIETGIPFLNIRNINSGSIDLTDVKYISKEDYETVHKTWQPEVNDILISRIGTLGLVAIIRKKDLPMAVHYNFIDIKADSLPHQVMYFILKSEYFQQKYHLIKKQSVQEYVTINEVENIKLALPNEFTDLEYCFELLESLYEKIESNQIECEKLIIIRDSLLPKLMSCELRVPISEV